MRPKHSFRIGLVFVLVAALGGCSGPCDKLDSITGPGLNANGVDLSTYVAVGTSLTSGFESGGLVDRHQVHSFPSLFARQIGKTVDVQGNLGSFTQPTINHDGIPALLEIKSYSPLIISDTLRTTGAPTNFAQPTAFHNMGIPGAILVDLVDSSFYHSAPPQIRSNFTYFNLIQRSRGLILTQALSLGPTIMSLEYGANEVLGPATNGVAPGASTSAIYGNLMTTALNAIRTLSPGTRVAVFNVPDVTSIPFFTTLSAFTQSLTNGQVIPLEGVAGPLQPGDLVLLSAADTIATWGCGIPAGGYNYLNPPLHDSTGPLPENLILRASEVVATQDQINNMNLVVDSVAARPNVAKVDLHGLLSTIATKGFSLGGVVYTSEFVKGGLFSLDGVHPNDLGYALMANTMISAVNARFGCFVPPVDPLSYASSNASMLSPVRDRYPRVEGLRQELRMLYGSQP
jgi:lysophospholipase L1-like esterase